MYVGTNLIYSGSMANASLAVRLPQSVEGTNASLVVTWSYDPQYPSNPAAPRNVQVAEIVFYERAVPGTFGDWSLHQFTDSQLADGAVGIRWLIRIMTECPISWSSPSAAIQ